MSLDHGWAWVVFVADFIAFFICGGFLQTAGIMQTTFLEKFGESEATTAWASSLFTAMCSLIGPIGSMLIDRTSCRVAVMTGGLMMSLGFLITGFANSIYICVVSFGLIAGFGSGLMYSAAFTVLGFNFREKLNFAQGVAATGTGVGLFALPPIMVGAKSAFGYTGVCLVISGIALQSVVAGALMRPSALEQKVKILRKPQVNQTKRKEQTILKRYLNLLLHRYILYMSISMLTFCGGIYTVYVHWPNFCLNKGFTPMQTSYVLSVSGVSSIIGRFGAGVIANFPCVDERLVYSGSFFIVGVPLVLFQFYSTFYVGHMVNSVIFGLSSGACFVVMTALNSKFLGVDNISAAIGIEFFFAGVGSIIFPVLSGYLLTGGWSYEYVFMAAGFCILIAAIFGLGTMCVQKKGMMSLSQENQTMIVNEMKGEKDTLMKEVC